MCKPVCGREEIFDPRALLAAVEEMSTVAGLKEPEDNAKPHNHCSGAVSGNTQHLLLSPTHVAGVNILHGAEGNLVCPS